MQTITSQVMAFVCDERYRFYVASSPSLLTAVSASSHVGLLLREWRTARRMSQLDLALESGISARHLSYVETGKAQPSRDMVERLADTLGMPLRERNALLIAAGYAPKYPETPLSTPEFSLVRNAIDLILEHQEPYPAFVFNRHLDIVLANKAMVRLFEFLCGGTLHQNVLHQVFDPKDVRPYVANWEEVAGCLIKHLHHVIASSPSDLRARTLLDEALSYPDVPSQWRTRELGGTPLPLLTVVFRKDGRELKFFSTMTMFGSPHDVTLEELHIECDFPADASTAEFCRTLAQTAAFAN